MCRYVKNIKPNLIQSACKWNSHVCVLQQIKVCSSWENENLQGCKNERWKNVILPTFPMHSLIDSHGFNIALVNSCDGNISILFYGSNWVNLLESIIIIHV